MIDDKTGAITILDISLSPSMDKDQLKRSSFYTSYIESEYDLSNSFIWYYFKPILLFDRNIAVALCFKADKLFSVEFTLTGEEFPTSYDNWTEQGELQRKLSHDEFLKSIFARQPDIQGSQPESLLKYIFPWGEVLSAYNIKSAQSYIAVKYYENLKMI